MKKNEKILEKQEFFFGTLKDISTRIHTLKQQLSSSKRTSERRLLPLFGTETLLHEREKAKVI